MAYIDITRVFLAQGSPVTYDDAQYRIWSAENAYWHLLEDPSQDLGRTWISQLPEEDFSTEDKILSYVEKVGGDFDYLLPAGADKQVDRTLHREESIWYGPALPIPMKSLWLSLLWRRVQVGGIWPPASRSGRPTRKYASSSDFPGLPLKAIIKSLEVLLAPTDILPL